MRPVIVDYDPGWPVQASTFRTQLLGALGSQALRVEHIGSTAVPGMAAKDVLDIQLSVDDLDEFDGALAGRSAILGLELQEPRRDHVPAGRVDVPAEWEKRLWTRRGHPGGDVNLHVRCAGSPNERIALLFRDWFRAHLEAVPAYAAFKSRLAAELADTDTYADVKDPVVDLVIAVAEPWAAATGWRVG